MNRGDTLAKKRLLSNFASLSVLQGANYLLPFITLPYLVRVLGPEKFGLVAFAQAFIQYFNILTDYGFNLSATREISIHREDGNELSGIFSAVMMIKLALLALSAVIMLCIVFSFGRFYQQRLVYYYAFGMVAGQCIFPVWFFQGMERMKYITFLNISARLIFTVCIFVFVHDVNDYIYVPLINSLGFMTAGILAFVIVFKDFHVRFTLPSVERIRHQLKEGWHIFISTVAISLYTTSNTFILGLLTNDTIVGYYSAAEKIIRAVQGLLTPVSQAVYPYVSRLIHTARGEGIRFLRRMTVMVGGVSFVLSAIIFFSAGIIVRLVLGGRYSESVAVLRILSFLPFVIALSNIFGIQTMLNLGYKKAFSRILIGASLLNIVLAFILVPPFRQTGISFAVLVSETVVTVSMFVYLQGRGIRMLGGKVCRTI